MFILCTCLTLGDCKVQQLISISFCCHAHGYTLLPGYKFKGWLYHTSSLKNQQCKALINTVSWRPARWHFTSDYLEMQREIEIKGNHCITTTHSRTQTNNIIVCSSDHLGSYQFFDTPYLFF